MIDIVLSKNQAQREPDAIWVTYSAAASRFLRVKSGRGPAMSRGEGRDYFRTGGRAVK